MLVVVFVVSESFRLQNLANYYKTALSLMFEMIEFLTFHICILKIFILAKLKNHKKY